MLDKKFPVNELLLCPTIDDAQWVACAAKTDGTVRGFLWDTELVLFRSYGMTHYCAFLKVTDGKRRKQNIHSSFIIQNDGDVTFERRPGTPIEKILPENKNLWPFFYQVKKYLGGSGAPKEVHRS